MPVKHCSHHQFRKVLQSQLSFETIRISKQRTAAKSKMLVKCLVLIAFLACVAAAQVPFAQSPECGISKVKRSADRIVDGEESKQDEWPWMAALGYRNKDNINKPFFKCAGTLISLKHVLTAAHCTTVEPDLYLVRFSALSLTSGSPVDILVDQVVVHSEYDQKTRANDIAVIKLQKDVIISDSLRPICLPLTPPLSTENYKGKLATVAGWGMTSFGGQQSDVLKQATIPIVLTEECKQAHSAIPDLVINNRTVCAGKREGGTNACQRDNGAPLMLEWENKFYEIGLFSFSYKCAEPGYPGVFTRTAAHIEFIARAMLQ